MAKPAGGWECFDTVEPLAIAAATLVAKGMLDGATNEMGKGVVAVVRKTIDYVRGKFNQDAEATAALTMLEARPADDIRVQLFAQVLDSRIRQDQEFARSLTNLIAEARETGAIGDVVDSGAVTGGNFYRLESIMPAGIKKFTIVPNLQIE
jgi:hypothetical protein